MRVDETVKSQSAERRWRRDSPNDPTKNGGRGDRLIKGDLWWVERRKGIINKRMTLFI